MRNAGSECVWAVWACVSGASNIACDSIPLVLTGGPYHVASQKSPSISCPSSSLQVLSFIISKYFCVSLFHSSEVSCIIKMQFPNTPPKMKYIGISLIKYILELHVENCKAHKKSKKFYLHLYLYLYLYVIKHILKFI